MIMYPTKGGSHFYKIFKPIVYIFLFTLSILFIHDSCMNDYLKEKADALESEEIIGGIKEFRNKNRDTNIYEVLYPGDPNKSEKIKPREHKQMGPLVEVASLSKHGAPAYSESDRENSIEKDGSIIETGVR